MENLLIALFVIAILLLLFSFLKKDRLSSLEEDLNQMMITHTQDMHMLKKRVKILEEEILIEGELPLINSPSSNFRQNVQINEILKSQVLSLYRQGLSLDQIAKQSTLSIESIVTIIEEKGPQGADYE